MDGCVYMSRRERLEMTKKEVLDARKKAIQNMIYFRNDKPLYIFWRNVYKGYHDAAVQSQGIFQTKEVQTI